MEGVAANIGYVLGMEVEVRLNEVEGGGVGDPMALESTGILAQEA